MNSASTLAGAMPAPARAPRLLGLYLLLILMAAIEAFDGLSHLPTLFGDMSEIAGPGLGGAIIKADIAVHPLLALSALACATAGRLSYAIIALGSLILMNWLNYMPSVVTHGLDLDPFSVAQMVGFPLIGACAIALAARDRRLGFATLLVCIPTLFSALSALAFGIGVFLYGF